MAADVETPVSVDVGARTIHEAEEEESELGLTLAQRHSMGLNDDTYEAIRDVFASLDEDGSGTIDISELGTAIKSMGVACSEAELTDLMERIDSDGNGSIDFYEFATMISDKMRDYDPEKELRDAFKVFDKDGDGKISIEELRVVVESLGEKMSKEDLESMLLEADDNNDGYLDYSEFVKIWIGDAATESDKDEDDKASDDKDEDISESD